MMLFCNFEVAELKRCLNHAFSFQVILASEAQAKNFIKKFYKQASWEWDDEFKNSILLPVLFYEKVNI